MGLSTPLKNIALVTGMTVCLGYFNDVVAQNNNPTDVLPNATKQIAPQLGDTIQYNGQDYRVTPTGFVLIESKDSQAPGPDVLGEVESRINALFEDLKGLELSFAQHQNTLGTMSTKARQQLILASRPKLDSAAYAYNALHAKMLSYKGDVASQKYSRVLWSLADTRQYLKNLYCGYYRYRMNTYVDRAFDDSFVDFLKKQGNAQESGMQIINGETGRVIANPDISYCIYDPANEFVGLKVKALSTWVLSLEGSIEDAHTALGTIESTYKAASKKNVRLAKQQLTISLSAFAMGEMGTIIQRSIDLMKLYEEISAIPNYGYYTFVSGVNTADFKAEEVEVALYFQSKITALYGKDDYEGDNAGAIDKLRDRYRALVEIAATD